MLVLVLQVVLDIEFGVFLQRLGSMEVASSLASINGNLRISRPVNNSHDIPIGLRTVSHETFELSFGNSMPSHDVLEKHLSILVLGLDIAASDCHDVLVGSVVHVASHGGPFGDTFNMVGHDPSMLGIPSGLHMPNQVDPITRADLGYLENKNFVHLITLARTLISLDIGPSADTFKLGDAIYNS